MNDDYDNELTDRDMLDRYGSMDHNPAFTKAEERVRRVALRGWSQQGLDFGEIQEIRAFLTGNSNDCPAGWRESYYATQERFSRGGKHVYVFRLVIAYPEGSRTPDGHTTANWKPALYDDKEWRRQLPLRARMRVSLSPKFRWPRERMFLSGDKAWSRAYWLTACGAKVTILRSEPVTWLHPATEEWAGIQSNW